MILSAPHNISVLKQVIKIFLAECLFERQGKTAYICVSRDVLASSPLWSALNHIHSFFSSSAFSGLRIFVLFSNCKVGISFCRRTHSTRNSNVKGVRRNYNRVQAVCSEWGRFPPSRDVLFEHFVPNTLRSKSA
jgi:hypothetical protein